MSIFEKYGKLPFTVNRSVLMVWKSKVKSKEQGQKDQEFFFYKMMG